MARKQIFSISTSFCIPSRAVSGIRPRTIIDCISGLAEPKGDDGSSFSRIHWARIVLPRVWAMKAASNAASSSTMGIAAACEVRRAGSRRHFFKMLLQSPQDVGGFDLDVRQGGRLAMPGVSVGFDPAAQSGETGGPQVGAA